MNLVKEAQSSKFDGIKVHKQDLAKLLQQDVGDLRVDFNIEPEDDKEEDMLSDGGELEGEITIEVGDDELHKEFSFSLPKVPGAEDQEDIGEAADIEVKEDEDVEVVDDPLHWTVETFPTWLSTGMRLAPAAGAWGIPRHSGKDVIGCERTIQHFRFLLKEISRCLRTDTKNVIAVEVLEKARDEILDGIERLEKRIKDIENFKRPAKRKAADFVNGEIVKEAQKIPGVGAITITVPLLISSLARSIINGSVSAGKSMEDTFKRLCAEYELSKIQKLELLQLLEDMGYPPLRRDLGMPLDKAIDFTSPDNVNINQQFYA